MDEQTEFAPQAVLGPRRGRWSQLVLVLPFAALVGIAWAGLSGGRSHDTAAATAPVETTDASAAALPSETAGPAFPTDALGITVQGLGNVRLFQLTRNDIIAISGWYVPLAVTACPSYVPSDAEAAGRTFEPGGDPWAECQRSGVLYASDPSFEHTAGNRATAVAVSLTSGVRLPIATEHVPADPLPIVVLGHFVETSNACRGLGLCPSELIVDYVAWTPAS